MIIDTHSHIYLDQFDEDRGQVIHRAKTSGVEKILLPNIDLESIAPMMKLAAEYPGYFQMMMGMHPSSVDINFQQNLKIIKDRLDTGYFVGVGEIGMDLYWDTKYKEEQEEAFRIQCNWAVEKNIPVSIHSRNAQNEVVRILKSLDEVPKGIFHCFGGSVSEAMEVIDVGLYLGIGGVVTFKNSKLKNVLKNVDLKHLVLETDAPYLAPHPKRGKRNEPAYLRYIVNALAEVYSVSPNEIEHVTSENVVKLYNL